MIDAGEFIRNHLTLMPAPGVSEIRLYRAHARSGLKQLVGEDGPPPYWAYGWAGGTVLARYILDHPEILAGRRVLDLGCGSGIVAIAAAMAGAAQVTAHDVDPYAIMAARLNAEANGVAVDVENTLYSLPDIDIVLGGDIFYDEDVAVRSLSLLNSYLAAGVTVLVGDPGSRFLPFGRLSKVAEYAVPDFGDVEPKSAVVYRMM